MNAFCTEDECIGMGLENIQFLYCSKPGYMKNKHVAGGLILFVEKNSDKFVKAIMSLVLPEGKIVVLIDCGDSYDLSSKVYWGLKASGFGETKILVNGDWKMLPIVSEDIVEVAKTDQEYLPFNNSIVLKKSDLESIESFYQQIIHVEKCEFPVSDSFLKKSEIFAYFKEIGVNFSQNRSSIVFGKKACFAGILIHLITGKTVSVVIDKITKDPIADRHSTTIQVQDPKNSGYSLTIDDHFKPTYIKPRQPLERESSVCANCLVI